MSWPGKSRHLRRRRNAGPRSCTVGPPGCAREVITVGRPHHPCRPGPSPWLLSPPGPHHRQTGQARPALPGWPSPPVGRPREHGRSVSDFPEHYVRASGSSMARPSPERRLILQVPRHPSASARVLCAAAATWERMPTPRAVAGEHRPCRRSCPQMTSWSRRRSRALGLPPGRLAGAGGILPPSGGGVAVPRGRNLHATTDREFLPGVHPQPQSSIIWVSHSQEVGPLHPRAPRAIRLLSWTSALSTASS